MPSDPKRKRLLPMIGKGRNILLVGIIGSVITAICCFTPVLVVLFGAIGLSVVVGYLDHVLLPALAFFLGVTVYGLLINKQLTTKHENAP